MTEEDKEKDFGYDKMKPLHGIIHRDSHKFLELSNTQTVNKLIPMWTEHMKENYKNRMWIKHGSFVSGCHQLGIGKAAIGVGAGASFNINAHILKYIHDRDGIKSWEDRDFLIFASNHQFKPLLKMGIIPDFVFLVDASGMPSVHRQLCEDIPESGKSSVLIAPFHAAPNVMKSWEDQGRKILFFISSHGELKKAFTDITKKDPNGHSIVCGGNVVNTMWMFSAKVFESKIFMCIGNDLSFQIKDTKQKQEESYYSDGDYSTNAPVTGSGRDEASCEKKWLGYKIQKRPIFIPGQNEFEVVGNEIVGTSHSLWVYKTWMEESMLLMTGMYNHMGLHYYNCTEGGILGVMAKNLEDTELKKNENWYMLDEVCPRWHTTTLENAAIHFLQAKEQVRCQAKGMLLQDVQHATRLVQHA